MRVIAVINQKGGSGKTTTAINLAAALAQLEQRTLLVDMDPQSHCALGLAIPHERIDLHVGDALLAPRDRPLDAHRLVWGVMRGLDLIPSAPKLAGLEAARGGLAEREDRDQRLGQLLARFADVYPWCVVDCPPSIGLLTFNALRAATAILIPVETSYFAVHGAESQVSTIQALARRVGGIAPHYVVPTMHDENTVVARDMLERIRVKLGEALTPVTIRWDARLREAASLGLPIGEYDPDSTGAADYSALASWMLEHAAEGSDSVALNSLSVLADGGQRSSAAESHGSPSMIEYGRPTSTTTVVMTRAAELAARANRLAQRGQALTEKLQADPRVAAHIEPRPTPASAVRSMTVLYGARWTSQGVLFVQPAAPTARIAVAGDHNGWSSHLNTLRYNSELGVHEGCIPMPPGRNRYRLVIDGRWTSDPHNPLVERNPFGEYDSVIEVPLHAGAPEEHRAA